MMLEFDRARLATYNAYCWKIFTQTVTHTMKSNLFFAVLFLSMSAGALVHAQSVDEIIVEPPRVVERWFAALGSVSRRDFGELISEDARIVLKGRGIEQSKPEFIAALDEWDKSTKNANIVYRYETIEEGNASVLVCYRFATKEQLIEERFTFAGDQITGSVQEPQGDSCGAM